MSSSFGTDETVNIHFVIPGSKEGPDECTEELKNAFQVCLDHSLNTKWIPGTECLALHPVKTDVFVFEEFNGSAFGYVRSFNCIIIGPRCILDCMAADILIPKSNFPLFTLAMRDLVVTTTGFNEPQKTLLGEKIQYMGGTYCLECRQSVTHVVANHLDSAKYEKAIENNIPVMTEQWVEAVWEEGQKRNVHARDEEFQKYKCPVFHNLVVTCTQVPRGLKQKVKESVTDNGGEFCGALESGRTSVLVAAKPFGDKFTHAAMWKIPRVSPSWVFDSIAKGHALPFAKYVYDTHSLEQKTSTPERTVACFPDISASTIQWSEAQVNETLNIDCTVASKTTNYSLAAVKQLESPKKNKYMELINKINISDVKKAGVFLDGCNIYFSGFSPEYTEKLRKITNSGGGTRFNEISDSVTHVIVGDFVQSDIKILKSRGSRLHVVTVEWLIESIRLHSAAPEDLFSCLDDLPSPIEFQSPLSKKGFLALHTQNQSHVRTIDMSHTPSPKKPLMPKNLLQQYSPLGQNDEEKHTSAEDVSQDVGNITMQNKVPGASRSQEDTDVTQMSTADSTQGIIFNETTFSIAGYPGNAAAEIEKLITCGGGQVVPRRFKGIPDYGVVPLHGANLYHTTTEIVTHIWLDDCVEDGMIVPVRYYHQPVNFALEAKPLSGCVVTTTLYSGSELRFVIELMESLGAIHQPMMARVYRPSDNLQATTHVICPNNADCTSSRKYMAARKWGISLLSHHWLLSCAKEKKRVNEEPFLVTPGSPDSSFVIARTPISRASKRKCSEDDTRSKFVAPPSLLCVPVNANLHGANTPPSPSTSSHRTALGNNTPVLKTAVQMSNALNTPEELMLNTPRSPGDIPTPDTPYGQVFKENPSPKTRKMWKKWIDQWPEEPTYKPPPPRERRMSTPMSELIRRGWEKFAIEPYNKWKAQKENDMMGSEIENVEDDLSISQSKKMLGDVPTVQEDNIPTTTQSPGVGINTQLQELNQILDSASKSARSGKENDTDNQSTPRAPPARHMSQAPESLDLGTDLVEWVDPVISNQQKSTPVFTLTAIDNREYYEEIVRSLGGIVSSSQIFDPNTTHVVCQQPSRNEKLLSSIAAGKWVLHKQYLEDSKKEGHFLDEDSYEWGNPNAPYLKAFFKKGSINELLAKATYRWRRKIQESGSGAFTGMRAIVCTSKEKLDLYKRLIIAGDGEVLPISPPYSEPENATVCIIELAKVQHRVDLQALLEKKVPCVPPLYLNDFLINDPSPAVENCLIPEYSALL